MMPVTISRRLGPALAAVGLACALLALGADAGAAPTPPPRAEGAHPSKAPRSRRARPAASKTGKVAAPKAKAAKAPAAGGSEPAAAAPSEAPVAAPGAKEPRDVVKTEEAREGEKVYTFGAQEVEGRLKSPQILYFLRRVRAEFDPAPLGHRSFLLELSDTRRHPAFE